MNLLTGKAHKIFLSWLDEQELAPYRVMFDEIPVIVQISYITQWLDSVNIHVIVEYQRVLNSFVSEVDALGKLRTDVSVKKTRIESYIEGIKQADIIFNKYIK